MINKFKILDLANELEEYVRLHIANTIPNIHRDLRIHLLDECYELERAIIWASHTRGNIRRKWLCELHVRLSLIDNSLQKLHKIQHVDARRLEICGKKLSELKTIAYAWSENEQ